MSPLQWHAQATLTLAELNPWRQRRFVQLPPSPSGQIGASRPKKITQTSPTINQNFSGLLTPCPATFLKRSSYKTTEHGMCRMLKMVPFGPRSTNDRQCRSLTTAARKMIEKENLNTANRTQEKPPHHVRRQTSKSVEMVRCHLCNVMSSVALEPEVRVIRS